MRTYAYNLQVAAIQDLKITGSHFRLLEATNDLYVSFGNGPFMKFKAGQGVTMLRDSVTDIRLKTLVAQNILLVAGDGHFHDANENVSVNATATVENSNTVNPLAEVSIPAGATVLLSAALATRKELRIGVKGSAANGVYIGDATVAVAKQGGYIEEGSVDYVGTTAAVYGYNSGGAAINVNVMDLVKI